MATLSFTDGQSQPVPRPSGKQLIPNIVDGLAAIRPESTWAKIPRNPESWDQGYRQITYRLFSNAINALATWIRKTIGPPSQPFQSIAYFGTYDPRYTILILAAIKAGYKAVFPSAARGKDGLIKFLGQVECHIILTASRNMPIQQELSRLADRIRIFDIPSLADLLEAKQIHVPYTKTFAQAKDDPVLVLHTSGTTGEPKPLIYTNDWMASFIEHNQALAPPGFRSVEHMYHGVQMFAFTPQAHVGGLLSNLLGAVPNGITCVYPLPASTLTLDAMFDTLRQVPVDLLISPTHLLDQVSLSEDNISFLSSHTRMVAFGGGPLSERTGNLLTKHVTLFPMYGIGEASIFAKIVPDEPWNPEWWNYFAPNPICGLEMRSLPGTDNSFEAVVVRKPDQKQAQPVFKMFPDLDEWATKDIFTSHKVPLSIGKGIFTFYSYAHRRDDAIQLIVEDPVLLIVGKTIFPLKFEQALSGTRHIKAALVFGEKKGYPGLLLELNAPPPDYEVPRAVLEEVRKNMQLLGTELDPQHVLLARSEKPLPRALKGTVQRPAAIKLYKEEIDAFYRNAS